MPSRGEPRQDCLDKDQDRGSDIDALGWSHEEGEGEVGGEEKDREHGEGGGKVENGACLPTGQEFPWEPYLRSKAYKGSITVDQCHNYAIFRCYNQSL